MIPLSISFGAWCRGVRGFGVNRPLSFWEDEVVVVGIGEMAVLTMRISSAEPGGGRRGRQVRGGGDLWG